MRYVDVKCDLSLASILVFELTNVFDPQPQVTELTRIPHV